MSKSPAHPLDLSALRVFLAVARTGSLTKGALALRMQQPTVSRTIAALENATRTQLFERLARGVALTAAGERLFARVAPQFEALEQSVYDALSPHDVRSVLSIGASEFVAREVIPSVHETMHKKTPQTDLYVTVATADVLLERVFQGSLRFALVMHARRREGLGFRQIAPVPHSIVVARHAAHDRAVLARFIGSREVEDPHNRRYVALEKLRARVPEARIHVSSNSLSLHLALVLRGFGVAVLPDLLTRHALENRSVVRVVPTTLSFPLLCVSRKGTVWLPTERAFLQACEDVLLRANAQVNDIT